MPHGCIVDQNNIDDNLLQPAQTLYRWIRKVLKKGLLAKQRWWCSHCEPGFTQAQTISSNTVKTSLQLNTKTHIINNRQVVIKSNRRRMRKKGGNPQKAKHLLVPSLRYLEVAHLTMVPFLAMLEGGFETFSWPPGKIDPKPSHFHDPRKAQKPRYLGCVFFSQLVVWGYSHSYQYKHTGKKCVTVDVAIFSAFWSSHLLGVSCWVMIRQN